MRNQHFNGERFVTLCTLLVVSIMVAVTQATGEVQGWSNVFAAYMAAVIAVGVAVPLAYQIVDAYEQLTNEIRTAATVSMRREKNGGWNMPDNVCPGCGRSFSMQSGYLLAKEDHYVSIMPECSAAWIVNGWVLYHDPTNTK